MKKEGGGPFVKKKKGGGISESDRRIYAAKRIKRIDEIMFGHGTHLILLHIVKECKQSNKKSPNKYVSFFSVKLEKIFQQPLLLEVLNIFFSNSIFFFIF